VSLKELLMDEVFEFRRRPGPLLVGWFLPLPETDVQCTARYVDTVVVREHGADIVYTNVALKGRENDIADRREFLPWAPHGGGLRWVGAKEKGLVQR
jgi:hypothetical protein